jgi:type I restriction enzyme S subunit
MKVSKGFKQTEIGEIPEDWEVKYLGDIGENIIGLTYEPKDVREYGHLVLRSSNIQNNKLAFGDNVFVQMDLPSRVLVKENDILICVRNGSKQLIGKCALIDSSAEGSAFGAFMSIFRTPFGNYVFHQLQSNLVQKQINQAMGATINQLTNKDIASFKIPFPIDIKEQQAIAEVLSDMDRMISQTETLIEKKKAIKQGMMQELLRPKDGWVEKKLRDIGLIITGSTPSTLIKEYWNGNVPWITPTDIGNKKNIYNSEREVSGSGFQKCRKLPKGTLLVTCIASIGKNAVLKVDGACNQQINAIIPNKEHDVDFLYYLMENNKSYLQTKAGITATLIISKKEFEEISFFFPPTHIEQSDIANILSEIEINIDIHVTKLQKLKLQKQGMMQALLTGRIRLT